MGFKRYFPLLITGCGLALFSACGNPHQKNVSTVYIHKYGVTLTQDDWEQRGSNGQVVITHADGTTTTQNFVEGKLEGKTTYSFPHSFVTQKEEQYRQGNLLSEVYHYTSGTPKKKVEFLSPDETQITQWYENATPQHVEKWANGRLMEGQYFSPSNDVESSVTNGNGTKIRRNPYGEYLSKMKVEKGEITLNTTYHRNGDPHIETPYRNNKIHGTRKQYLVNGIPDRFESWKDGVKEGITTIFQDGVPHSEMPFHQDKKNGVELIYNTQGQIVGEVSWKDDERDGPTKTYIQDVVRSEWYSHGKKVSKSEFEKSLKS